MYLDLTEKQVLILEFIKSQIILKGYPPAVREICTAVGLRSTSTVHSHLNKLEKLGYIRKDPTKPRAIEVLERSKVNDVSGANQEIIELPLVGQITAGEPILAQQNIEEYIPFPASLVKRFFKEGNLIRLQPENDFMEPIMLNDSEVEIVGIVTGVFRVIK